MRGILAASLLGLSLTVAGVAEAEPVKIGVITTLSGGGAGLGVDMRDAFTLAIKQSGQVTRSAIDDSLRPTSRDTKGVKFVGVRDGDAVAVVARSIESTLEEVLDEGPVASTGEPEPSGDGGTGTEPDGETEES